MAIQWTLLYLGGGGQTIPVYECDTFVATFKQTKKHVFKWVIMWTHLLNLINVTTTILDEMLYMHAQ